MRRAIVILAAVAFSCSAPGGDEIRTDRQRDHDAALERLARDLERGRVTAAAVLLDPDLEWLKGEPRFQRLMRVHATAWELTLVREDEPGTRLTVEGTVRDTDGNAVAGATVYVYQTDHAGHYSPGGDDERRPRIYGFMKTDAGGRYRYHTIRPGTYATDASMPQHVHYVVRKEGYVRAHGSGPPSLFFADDPRLAPGHRAEIEADGAFIAEVRTDADGRQFCTYDYVLRRK